MEYENVEGDVDHGDHEDPEEKKEADAPKDDGQVTPEAEEIKFFPKIDLEEVKISQMEEENLKLKEELRKLENARKEKSKKKKAVAKKKTKKSNKKTELELEVVMPRVKRGMGMEMMDEYGRRAYEEALLPQPPPMPLRRSVRGRVAPAEYYDVYSSRGRGDRY